MSPICFVITGSTEKSEFHFLNTGREYVYSLEEVSMRKVCYNTYYNVLRAVTKICKIYMKMNLS